MLHFSIIIFAKVKPETPCACYSKKNQCIFSAAKNKNLLFKFFFSIFITICFHGRNMLVECLCECPQLSVCVCVYVCMYLYMYVCMYVVCLSVRSVP